jgi:hypothetical protein
VTRAWGADGIRTVLYTALALVAFAANSVLCRIALLHRTIDAATFSAIRLTAGAAVLLAFAMGRQKHTLPMKGSWTSASMLFLYATVMVLTGISLALVGRSRSGPVPLQPMSKAP